MRESILLWSKPWTGLEVATLARGGVAHLDPTLAGALDASAAELAASPSWDVVGDLARWLGATGPVGARDFVEAHVTSVGAPLTEEEVRATLAVRAHALSRGASGVRAANVAGWLAGLDAPWRVPIPREGSLGSAGCPILAGIARVLFGWSGVPGSLPEPTPKEALAALNGSSHATALAVLAVDGARTVLAAAEAAAALSFEAQRADFGCIDPRAYARGGAPGAGALAMRLRGALRGSGLAGVGRVPDPFSIRCAPIVQGAADDVLGNVSSVVDRELASPADNPLWIDGEWIFAGLHHGAAVGGAMDALKVALVHVAGISERRTYRLTYGGLSGLPSFLVADGGLQSGLMLAQYTAASLLGDARGLSMPASVDGLPTAQHHEDHAPNAARAARTARDVVDRVADIVTIELMCAAQAIDLRLANGDGFLAEGTKVIYDRVRAVVARWDHDRVLHDDLVALGCAVRQGQFAI